MEKHIHKIDEKWAKKHLVGECFCGERFTLRLRTEIVLPKGVEYGNAPASAW